jgi:hypothetical protein
MEEKRNAYRYLVGKSAGIDCLEEDNIKWIFSRSMGGC